MMENIFNGILTKMEKRKLQKQISQIMGECEALKLQISELESQLAIEKLRYSIQENVMEKELAEREIEIANYREIVLSLQTKLNDLQKERTDYVIETAKLRSQEKKLKDDGLLRKAEKSNNSTTLEKDGYVNSIEDLKNNAARLSEGMDESVEAVIRNGGVTINNYQIQKVDQLTGIQEQGSQVIHTLKNNL